MPECKACEGRRIELGGWMGPTLEAPLPRPCSTCSPDLTNRQIQVAQTQWLMDNSWREDVQQILARKAVMDAAGYRKVVMGRVGLKAPLGLLAAADLVIGPGGIVTKDRYGTDGYRLSETEMRRIHDDCGEWIEV